jgi:hypothetical protein
MRKLGITAVFSFIVTALAAAPALAVTCTVTNRTGGLHVCQGSSLIVTADKTDGAFLTASGEVCGAGTTATAALNSTVEATVGCVTRSGAGEPSGLQETSTGTTAEVTFRTRSGRGTFDLTSDTITIADFDFECPSRQQSEVIVGSVTFTDITLAITSSTGTITATCPDLDP